MKNVIIFCLIILLLNSCKTVQLQRENFFDAPTNKIRLFESNDFSENHLTYETRMINVSDSIKVETRIISTKSPANCFFFFTPSSNNIGIFEEIMEKVALRTNSKTIGVQYRGFNFSNGVPNFDSSFKDNEVIYEKFSHEFEKYKTINFVGLSIGTVFAPKLAARHQGEVNNLILMSTFSSPEVMLKGLKSSIPSFMRPFIKLKADKKLLDLNNVILLDNYKNGLLIIQAKDDKETNYMMAEELFNKVNTKKKELMTLENGGHFAPFSKKYTDSVVNKIVRFIK